MVHYDSFRNIPTREHVVNYYTDLTRLPGQFDMIRLTKQEDNRPHHSPEKHLLTKNKLDQSFNHTGRFVKSLLFPHVNKLEFLSLKIARSD